MLPKEVSVVTKIENRCIFGQPLLVERLQNPPQVLVHRNQRPAVVFHILLILLHRVEQLMEVIMVVTLDKPVRLIFVRLIVSGRQWSLYVVKQRLQMLRRRAG